MTHAIRIHETGGPGVLRWDAVEVGESAAIIVERRQQPIEVFAFEAGQIEVDAGSIESVQFGGEQLVIPAGELGKAVIGDAVGADLLRRQVLKADDRHLLKAEVLRGQQPTIAGDDLAVIGHHHRRCPAVLDQ